MVVFLSGNISDSKVQIIVNNTALYHRNDYTAGEPFAKTGRYAGQNEVILQLTDRFARDNSDYVFFDFAGAGDRDNRCISAV